MTDTDKDAVAHGWNAIDAACDTLYPGQTPKHYGTLLSYRLGGPDPLQGISAWKRADPVPHWHIVTYGFTELYEKESDDAEFSGYGFELTFRLRCAPEAEEPPMWAMNFLQNLARYVFQTGNVFKDGDWMPLNGPIAADENTLLTYAAFITDPELPAQDTPNGHMTFLQVVGLTDDEAFAARQWRTLKLLQVLQPHMPLWITDLARASLLARDGVRESIAQGTRTDGSSTGYVYTDALQWRQEKRLLQKPVTVIAIGALQVRESTTLLPLRLPFGRSFRVIGPEGSVLFAPGDSNTVRLEDNVLHVTLNDTAASEIAAVLRPERGRYALQSFKGLCFEVRPTEIHDSHGQVTDTIG